MTLYGAMNYGSGPIITPLAPTPSGEGIRYNMIRVNKIIKELDTVKELNLQPGSTLVGTIPEDESDSRTTQSTFSRADQDWRSETISTVKECLSTGIISQTNPYIFIFQ